VDKLSESLIGRSVGLVYDFFGISLGNDEVVDLIYEALIIMNIFSRDLALHCIRVSNYSAAIGKHLGLCKKDTEQLWCAAMLHDIGKCKLPLKILDKPGKLTKEEYNLIKTHSNIGYEVTIKNNKLKEISKIILYHHERFDGYGYPSGITGRTIPLMSRILAVADAFDAMTSNRPYREIIPVDSALIELKKGKWTQFDGDIVDCFIELVEGSSFNSKEMNMLFGLY